MILVFFQKNRWHINGYQYNLGNLLLDRQRKYEYNQYIPRVVL